MTTTTRCLAAALLLLATTGRSRAEEPDPHAVIAAADAARLDARAAAYTARIVMEDAAGSRRERAVDVWLRKWDESDWKPAPPPPPPPAAAGGQPVAVAAIATISPHRVNSAYKANVRAEYGEGNVLVADLDRVTVLDPTERTIVVHALWQGGETRFDLTDTAIAVSTPLLDTRSLAEDAAGAASVTWAGTATVDGTECDVVRLDVPLAEGRAIMHWSIARRDHLFRRGRIEMGEVTLEVTLENLHVGLPLPSSTFVLAGPEGYREETYTPPPRPEILGAGAAAPRWTLRAPDGRETSLSDLRGRIVLIDFWGSWCGPCRMAMPQLQKLHETYAPRGVAVIGIACRERDDERPVAAMEELDCTYALLLQGDDVAKRYNVPGYPSLFVVDQDGVIAASHVGFSATLYEELSAVIDQLLAEGG
ncbi:MAG: TlpA family protein disulfide reductase [Planctomycetota bacterium]|jgi:thiol-disulfide isomerase/thioredoxin